MSVSPIAIFAAGFVAGGLILSGSIAGANLLIHERTRGGGVLPGHYASLFCIHANGTLRIGVRGHIGNARASEQIGGPAYGVGFQCPA